MAKVRPFKGLLYNPAKVGDVSKVMAPPYDVISPEMRAGLHERHSNNVIRLILPHSGPHSGPRSGPGGDESGADRYSRAAEDLKNWTDEGVLTRDTVPAIYYYTQEYSGEKGPKRTRKGFIALARIEDFGTGGIMPHEKTLSGPKADRLSLMQACNANLSCIFSLYPEADGEQSINSVLEGGAQGEPLIEVKGDDGVVNRLWRIVDAGVIEKVAGAMKDKKLFIADGHHRYETALNYRNMMRDKHSGPTSEEPFNYVMMYFTAMDEGLEIFPTHRVIHGLDLSVEGGVSGGAMGAGVAAVGPGGGFDGVEFIKDCEKCFYIDEIAFDDATEPTVREEFFTRLAEGAGENARLGLFIRGGSSYLILTLISKQVMDDIFADTIPAEYRTLDVTVLHSLVLDKLLGITPGDQEKQSNIIYVKGLDEALSAGRAPTNQLVFLMNPTKVEQVRAVSEAGLLMPQKSTYFYPKLLTGLVINPLVK